MARMSEGNRLYLYKLLKEELGIGRQSSVSQFEDVLSADDIAPQDLECESTLELLESLDDIVKLTVFKKGRVFVTLLSHERYDAILERLEKPAEKDASDKSTKAKQKPWKRKKSAKDPTPAKPRKKKTPVVEPVAEDFVVEEPVVETAEPEPVETTEAERTEKTEVGHIEKTELNQTTEAEQVELPEPEQVVGAELVKEADAQQTEAVNINQTEKELTAETSDTEVSVIAPEVSSADEKRPSITLTIVHDPDDEVALDAAASQAAPNPELARPPAPPSLTRQEHTSAHDLPQSIAQDVFCGTPQLRILHQLLPYDADALQVIEEDWRVARSVGSVSGSRAKLHFPLRYVHEDGTPLTVTLKRTTRHTSSKNWVLAYVDGNDGSGNVHVSVAAEGLAAEYEELWLSLVGTRSSHNGLSVEREFAQFAELGSWDTLLGSLATLAAPERWNMPREGVGQERRYGILREYLSLRFHRIQHENKLAVNHDGSFAAFDTGLLTPFAERIFACFEAQRSDIAWKLAGFSVAGSGDLGVRLVSEFDPLPRPACFLTQLSDIVPEAQRMTILDIESLLSVQLGRLPRAFVDEQLEGNSHAHTLYKELVAQAPHARLEQVGLIQLGRAIKSDPGLYRRMSHALEDAVELAFCRAQTSYRLAAPAYNPSEEKIVLLLPLCLVDDSQVDCAITLSLQPSGAYQGRAVLSLDRAYACARVISSEPPSWLDPDRVFDVL